MKSYLLWLGVVAVLGAVATGALIQGGKSAMNRGSMTKDSMTPAPTMDHSMGQMRGTTAPNTMGTGTKSAPATMMGGMKDGKANSMADSKMKPSM